MKSDEHLSWCLSDVYLMSRRYRPTGNYCDVKRFVNCTILLSLNFSLEYGTDHAVLYRESYFSQKPRNIFRKKINSADLYFQKLTMSLFLLRRKYIQQMLWCMYITFFWCLRLLEVWVVHRREDTWLLKRTLHALKCKVRDRETILWRTHVECQVLTTNYQS